MISFISNPLFRIHLLFLSNNGEILGFFMGHFGFGIIHSTRITAEGASFRRRRKLSRINLCMISGKIRIPRCIKNGYLPVTSLGSLVSQS